MALRATACNGVDFLHRKLQIVLLGKEAPADKSKFTSVTNKADKV